MTVSHGEGYLSELARDKKFKKFLYEIKFNSKRLGISPYKYFFSIYLRIITPNLLKKRLQYRLTKR